MWIVKDKSGQVCFWTCDEKPRTIACGEAWCCDHHRGWVLEDVPERWKNIPVDELTEVDIIGKEMEDELFRAQDKLWNLERGRIREELTDEKLNRIIEDFWNKNAFTEEEYAMVKNVAKETIRGIEEGHIKF